jgi:hypothetical protein
VQQGLLPARSLRGAGISCLRLGRYEEAANYFSQALGTEKVEKALKKDASSIILLHNHPNGMPYPSEDDKRFSLYLKDLLANFDITLIDHIIVSGRYYRPVFEGEIGENRFAAPKKFSYGEKILPTGIRICEPKAASDIPYKGNCE